MTWEWIDRTTPHRKKWIFAVNLRILFSNKSSHNQVNTP